MARLTAPKLVAIIDGVPQYIPAGADSEAYELSRPDPVAGAQWARETYPGLSYDQAIARRYQEDLGPQNGGIAKGAPMPTQAPTVQVPSPFMQAAAVAPQPQPAPVQKPVPVMQAPQAVRTYAPSQLASQESGAIGAASIASQMPKPKTSPFAQAAKPKPYSVQRGDTLSAIAAKNKMSLKQLMKLNPQFTQNKKYQGGNRIFSGTKVNLAPRPQKAPTTPGSFNPGSFRQAENRGM